jgi:RNA polymerase sigma-70 factor (ECF subfamily)
MSGQPPEDWLTRLQARDHEAFADLVRQHHGAVFRMAQRLLRHRDDAQEVVQETFLAAYEGIAGFQQRASIKTWLLAIAWRKAVDRLNHRSGEAHVRSDALDDDTLWRLAQSVEHLTDWGGNPEHHVARQQLSELLRAALARLPDDARAVYELRDVQGLSSQDAAEVLGLSEGAVRVRLHRVRQYLLRELQALLGLTGAQP